MNAILPFPELRSARFVLRQILQSDLNALYVGLSDPRVNLYYGIAYHSEAATQEQLDWYRSLENDGNGVWWAICAAQRPQQLIGACGIYEIDHYNRNADIGYWLSPQVWGQGVMQECLKLIFEYAFRQLQLHRLEAEVEIDNIASRKLLEKLGFMHEGRRRQVSWRGEKFVDLDYFGLLRSTP
ncbi:GNAT family protein [Undibacterium cyanobacteriorum]|uniref:GNAT family protein n=1 Tax=Undibacterium cyanobacteriorum TaxID=3073561 RepID=A0ABY9RIC3_9BURK|nr:GNAT family protein [Undibacterium sp. 20NA77.5]WMW80593.1 GNAT family protein [Undibacterium sp. 20NA77.5]